MAKNDAIIKFNEVDFSYGHNKKILDEADFTIRRGAKMALMGQNGAGKTTIFNLINGDLKPETGDVNLLPRQTIATSKQVIEPDRLDLTVTEFFQNIFEETIFDIDRQIDEVLALVHLPVAHDRVIRSFSGGQQARLLLASALIQKPDVLLLDEPTNNLDSAGIEHLTDFLVSYNNTVLVISHDAEFLNKFTEGVLYLDVHTKQVEQYTGNYHDVVKEISARIDKENRENSRLAKIAQAKKDQANVFANKGGRMRMVAKRMRAVAAEMEDNAIDVRQEDKVIRPFTIPTQKVTTVEVVKINKLQLIKDHQPVTRQADLVLRKRGRWHIIGPNGIGKTTLLEALTQSGDNPAGYELDPTIKVGYYRQDFSTLDFDQTPREALSGVMADYDEQRLRSVAAGFLITADIINTKIGSLSEGQKGLVAFAQLVLLEPGLLILDEPTNHINFRHLPIIAQAIDDYEGAMIITSHVPHFMDQIKIDEIIDLGKYLEKKK